MNATKQRSNPTRRNRNIGTAKQGHGGDNRMRIPTASGHDRIWWEQIGAHQVVDRNVSGQPIQFIVEDLRTDCIHACSIDDVCTVLAAVPAEDWAGVGAVLFRQPTRKQQLLEPSWGKLSMSAGFGRATQPDIYTGPAILLDAQMCSGAIRWGRHLNPESKKELERLRSDGHSITEDSRGYLITTSLRATRATLLYRTLLHEIGHWTDWLERVERPSEKLHDFSSDGYAALVDSYWARPALEREAFAHSYASAMRTRLHGKGVIPLPDVSDWKQPPGSPQT